MRGAEALLCEFPPANFDQFDQLRWIQLSSAGCTQIQHLPILEQGIRVTNGLGNFDLPIAEWNVMMMLMWQRDMLTQLRNQTNATWDRAAEFQSDLFGRTIGFYGYGGIARATGFSMRPTTQCGETTGATGRITEPGKITSVNRSPVVQEQAMSQNPPPSS